MNNVKKLFALLALVSVGCASKQLEPKMGLHEAACKTQAVLYALGNNEALAEKVLNGDMTITDAVSLIGGLDEDVYAAIEHWRACEPILAPPPAPGDKVL